MKIFRSDEVLWREEDEPKAQAYEGLSRGEDVADMGTSVLFSDGIMLSLNVLGTEIWKRCDGRSMDEILADLLLQFDVDPDVLREDSLAFLSELQQKGFIRYEE
ncbi:MAG TPA: GeoRSP system PqqD family peptide chaperone [Nitrospiraceae bacterium]|jgi:GeoRSP system PqqD family protein|nr:GeoRSP system PqqD family peptide chaperone [Nitrospiraceae bacterium]